MPKEQQILDYVHTTPWSHERLPGLEVASIELDRANGLQQTMRDQIVRFICTHFELPLDSVSCILTSARGKGPVLEVHGGKNVGKLIASGVPMIPVTISANFTKTLNLT